MSGDIRLVVTLLLGYLVGAIPFAYLVTKWATGRDVRHEGSGNVGTRNAFVVSRKFGVGIAVLAADLLKGAIPVLILSSLGEYDLVVVVVPALILGHCYPVWLRFHGGKGLATTAGALLVSFPVFPVFWGVMYLVTKRLQDDVDTATIIACAASLIAVLFVTQDLLQWTSVGIPAIAVDVRKIQLSVCLVILIILSRHAEPLRQLLGKGGKA